MNVLTCRVCLYISVFHGHMTFHPLNCEGRFCNGLLKKRPMPKNTLAGHTATPYQIHFTMLCVCVCKPTHHRGILLRRAANRTVEWESVTVWKTGGRLWGRRSNYTSVRLIQVQLWRLFGWLQTGGGAQRKGRQERQLVTERKEMEEFQSNTITTSGSSAFATITPTSCGGAGFTSAPAVFLLHPSPALSMCLMSTWGNA